MIVIIIIFIKEWVGGWNGVSFLDFLLRESIGLIFIDI